MHYILYISCIKYHIVEYLFQDQRTYSWENLSFPMVCMLSAPYLTNHSLQDETYPSPSPAPSPSKAVNKGPGGDSTVETGSSMEPLGSQQPHRVEAPNLATPPREESLARSVVLKRLGRLFKQKADGTYNVSDELVGMWRTEPGRAQILQEYGKTGYNKDQFNSYTHREYCWCWGDILLL